MWLNANSHTDKVNSRFYSFCQWTRFLTQVLSCRLQVMDIAKLMKAYISMIVKKRYSNSQSVSSQDSNHGSAW